MKIPKLLSWTVLEFSEQGINLNLNFSDPLSVSIYRSKDLVSFKVLNPKLFSATLDKFMVAANYSVSDITVP